MPIPWSSKKECRSYYKSLCAQEFAQGLVHHQQQLNAHLIAFLLGQSGVWGAYRALPMEASVDLVLGFQPLRWAFPRMKDGQLDFFETRAFELGPYGVLEPPLGSANHRALSEISGLLIPGLSFNLNGVRLGKGKGFYDKTLSDYDGLKVGVAFDFQISAYPLPAEDHDIRMDYIVSESGLIDCRKY